MAQVSNDDLCTGILENALTLADEVSITFCKGAIAKGYPVPALTLIGWALTLATVVDEFRFAENACKKDYWTLERFLKNLQSPSRTIASDAPRNERPANFVTAPPCILPTFKNVDRGLIVLLGYTVQIVAGAVVISPSTAPHDIPRCMQETFFVRSSDVPTLERKERL